MNRCCKMYVGQEFNSPKCWVIASNSNIFGGGVLKKQSTDQFIIIFNLSTATDVCLSIHTVLIKHLFPNIIYIHLLERSGPKTLFYFVSHIQTTRDI